LAESKRLRRVCGDANQVVLTRVNQTFLHSKRANVVEKKEEEKERENRKMSEKNKLSLKRKIQR